MASTTIRITESDKQVLTDLKEQFGEPIQQLLHEAIEHYRREKLLRASNEAYGKLRQNAKAREAAEREREAWDAALADGLD